MWLFYENHVVGAMHAALLCLNRRFCQVLMAHLHKKRIKIRKHLNFITFRPENRLIFLPGLVSSSPVDKIQMGTSEMCVESIATPTLANSDLNCTISGKSLVPRNKRSPFVRSFPIGLKITKMPRNCVNKKLNKFFFREISNSLFQITVYLVPLLVQSRYQLLFRYHFLISPNLYLQFEQLH